MILIPHPLPLLSWSLSDHPELCAHPTHHQALIILLAAGGSQLSYFRPRMMLRSEVTFKPFTGMATKPVNLGIFVQSQSHTVDGFFNWY